MLIAREAHVWPTMSRSLSSNWHKRTIESAKFCGRRKGASRHVYMISFKNIGKLVTQNDWGLTMST